MKPYFIYLFCYFLIYLSNIIQHNITINFTITGRKKGGKTVKNKQTNKKSEVRKFQQIDNNWKNKQKNNNSARLLNYYKSTLIRNAQGGPLISVFVKISVCYCNFSFALDFNFQENNENFQLWGLKFVSS